jgi:TRAP-type transport system periplasmic protein
MKLGKLIASMFVGVSLSLAGAGAALAKDVRIVVGVGQNSAPHFGVEAFGKQLRERTNGALAVKVFPSSLLNLTQTLGGIRDGVVDGGYMVTQLFPSDLPEAQLPIELAMLGTNSLAIAAATSEYIFTCKECLDERQKHNMVYLGSAATGSYAILGTKKMSTLDELKGKKLRAAAAPWARWAQHHGAVAVNLSGNEIFEAVAQGTIDGAMNAASELSSLRLIDVVKHVTVNLPGGTVHGLEPLAVNRNFWRGLTEAQRRAYLDAAALGNATTTWKFNNDIAVNLKAAQDKGIQIHQAAPDVVARSRAFIDADVANIAATAAKIHGIKDTPAKIARFRTLLDKWEKLLPATTTWEAAAVAEILQREIYSKLDAKTYGM